MNYDVNGSGNHFVRGMTIPAYLEQTYGGPMPIPKRWASLSVIDGGYTAQ